MDRVKTPGRVIPACLPGILFVGVWPAGRGVGDIRPVTTVLDHGNIATSRDVGTGAVFDRAIRGKALTFPAERPWIYQRPDRKYVEHTRDSVERSTREARLVSVVHTQPFRFA